MVGLGDLEGGVFRSGANAVSADGSFIVGWGISGNGTEAYRWTEETGMVGLGDLAGGSFSSQATAVSASGTIIVGSAMTARGTEAFWWTQEGGMRTLQEVLEAQGVDLAGWRLTSATAISSD